PALGRDGARGRGARATERARAADVEGFCTDATRVRRHVSCGGGRPVIVNQWMPAAHTGDAVGDNARRIRELLRSLGHTADLFAVQIDDGLVDHVRPFDDPAAARGDVTILHYAISSPMTAAFASLPGRRVVQYHNVTPAVFFAPYDMDLFQLATRGRE